MHEFADKGREWLENEIERDPTLIQRTIRGPMVAHSSVRRELDESQSRAEAIKELMESIKEVAQMVKELAELTDQYGELVDKVVVNVRSAH